ncbi:YqjK family protein [Peristeroidobacter soli]|uniref:YqjK family protein n=1 Tax=Peristeroidobacter soli TaxID=2497877 RepID=UPI00101DD72C|nr:YqjK family protein [Peristeroidobacter soli]
MSSERFNQLTAKHSNLRLRAAVQRRALGSNMNEIEHHLSGLDRGIGAAQRALKNPAVLIGGVALVALIGPKRLMRWVSRGALVYTTARRFMRLRPRQE